MACAILERTSGLEPSSETTAPRYLKLITVPNFCPVPLSLSGCHWRCVCCHRASLQNRQDKFPEIYWLPSVLFYSITLEGRRGTTDEFTTIPFHLVLFSAALVELEKSIPVHSLILSSNLFFYLPLFLFPFTVPCRIVFAKPEDLETWPSILAFVF